MISSLSEILAGMNATGPVEALVGLDVGTAEVLLGVHVLSDFTDGATTWD